VKLGIEHLTTLQDAAWVAFDSETTGLQPTYGGLRLLQFAAPDCEPVVIDTWELHDDEWQPLQDFLAQDRTWVAHNAVFDLGWLQEYEIIPQGRLVCTMLASRLLRNGIPNLRHGLAQVCEHYLKVEVDKTEQKSDWSQPTLTREQIAYAAKDVELLVRLWQVMEPLLAKAQLAQALSLECKALHAVAMMNRAGLPFDKDALVELERHYQTEIARLGEAFVRDLDQALPQDAKLPRLTDGSINLNARATGSIRLGTKVEAGFNLNSPKQLVGAFTTLLGEIPKNPKTRKPSASRDALRGYAADHKVVQTYLGWKRAEKRRQMVQALLDHQDEDGFVRAGYMQLGADTGRFSCRNPNLQQVPRDKGFRLAAKAKPGYKFVVADFGQMELRLAAALSQDERMIQAFVDGDDLHTVTAQAIYPEVTEDEAELKMRRQVAKSANFGLLYGSGAKGLRDYAGSNGITMTLDEAQKVRDTFLATYQGIAAWQQSNAKQAQVKQGKGWPEVRIPGSGLRRFLLGDMDRLTTRCNTPVQGAGAAILKLALANLFPQVWRVRNHVTIAAVVHDEVLLLVRENLAQEWCDRLSQVMCEAEARWLGVIPPLADAACGDTWAEAK
jgi:DNA polymerase I-like protein with 3'-5' exonuclease and polymerase domains